MFAVKFLFPAFPVKSVFILETGTTFEQRMLQLQEVSSPHSDSERHSDSPTAHSDTPLTHTQVQKLKDGSNKTRRSLSVKEVKYKNKVKLERRKSDLELQVKFDVLPSYFAMFFIFVFLYHSGCS